MRFVSRFGSDLFFPGQFFVRLAHVLSGGDCPEVGSQAIFWFKEVVPYERLQNCHLGKAPISKKKTTVFSSWRAIQPSTIIRQSGNLAELQPS